MKKNKHQRQDVFEEPTPLHPFTGPGHEEGVGGSVAVPLTTNSAITDHAGTLVHRELSRQTMLLQQMVAELKNLSRLQLMTHHATNTLLARTPYVPRQPDPTDDKG